MDPNDKVNVEKENFNDLNNKENNDINIDISEDFEEFENNNVEEEKNKKKDDKEKIKNDTDEFIEKLINEDKKDIIKKYIKLYHENEKIKKSLKKFEHDANDYFDKYRRALADMENIRKRIIIEKQDSLKYANFNIISDLLVVLDDFQRAIDSAKADDKMDLNHFVDGIDMIEKQFVDLLFKKYGVTRFCEEGDEFDPNIHQGMMLQEGDYDKEIVIEVFRKGYLLHDRVIRPAEVKVGKPKDK